MEGEFILLLLRGEEKQVSGRKKKKNRAQNFIKLELLCLIDFFRLKLFSSFLASESFTTAHINK